LVADIKAPDYETRIAILQSKLEIKQETIEPELLGIIAQHITSNVRELE
jgi:chromosomal replication initiator protein